MIDLLLAVAGARTPDRPHWPVLPEVHLDADAFAHDDPACPRVGEGVTRLEPSLTPPPAAYCGCLQSTVNSLGTSLYAAELAAADDVLGELALLGEAQDLLADLLSTTAAELAAGAGAVLARADPTGWHAHWLLWNLATTVDRGRRCATELDALPALLAGPARDLLATGLPALEAALAALRREWPDEVLNTLASAELTSPVTGHAWLFEAATAERAETAAGWLAVLWPGRVHRSTDGTRLAALLPAAVARTWAFELSAEIVSADPHLAATGNAPQASGVLAVALNPAPVHTAEAAELAALTPAHVRAALALWQPRPAQPRTRPQQPGPMHALAALRAAAAVLADPADHPQ